MKRILLYTVCGLAMLTMFNTATYIINIIDPMSM